MSAKRKSKYADKADEIKPQIVRRISEGETLRAICREADMPFFNTVYHWLKEDSAFAQQMKEARDCGFEAIAEDCLSIADEPISSSEEVARNKLRIHTRLQLLSKWSNRYSDRQQVTLAADASIGQAILAARQRLGA